MSHRNQSAFAHDEVKKDIPHLGFRQVSLFTAGLMAFYRQVFRTKVPGSPSEDLESRQFLDLASYPALNHSREKSNEEFEPCQTFQKSRAQACCILLLEGCIPGRKRKQGLFERHVWLPCLWRRHRALDTISVGLRKHVYRRST